MAARETVDEAIARIISEIAVGNQKRHGTPWVWPGEVYLEAALRQMAEFQRERDAQIADEWTRGSLELAEIAKQCGCPGDARLHRLDSHVSMAIAKAIREVSRG